MQIHENRQYSVLWADLSRQAGLQQDGWRMTLVSRRAELRRVRSVWRLDRGDCALALKQVSAPLDAATFLAGVEAHHEVQERFDAVPRILAADVDRQTVLMTWAGDVTLFDALSTAAPQDRQKLLRRAGDWTARFHASGPIGQRIFQPGYSVRHLRRLMAEVRQGARAVAQAGAWLDCAETLIAQQAAHEGRVAVAALGHGDLNLRNLLVGSGVMGLDFRKGGPLPVGHDLARLFVHYGALLAEPGEGAVLPGVDLTGFFDGYTLTGPDDPGVTFLCRMRILIDWQTLPADSAAFSAAEARRFQGLLRLARAAFF